MDFLTSQPAALRPARGRWPSRQDGHLFSPPALVVDAQELAEVREPVRASGRPGPPLLVLDALPLREDGARCVLVQAHVATLGLLPSPIAHQRSRTRGRRADHVRLVAATDHAILDADARGRRLALLDAHPE